MKNGNRLAAIRLRDFQFREVDGAFPGLNQAGRDRRWLLAELEAAWAELREIRAEMKREVGRG